MPTQSDHISVCICTYKRPELLARLLELLAKQSSGGLFSYSIVVVDNDHLRSAETVVAAFAGSSPIPVRYCVEPRQNIAMARNKAVENAVGNYISFIDDDELPIQEWLLTLYQACNKYGAHGALGPVKPRFEIDPPKWVVKSNLYDRPTYETGFIIDWRKGRTGNVLLRTEVFADTSLRFRPEFRTGEDQDFFRRAIAAGHVFVWCNEAVAYEVVPPVRLKRSFMLKRAFLRGASARLHPKSPLVSIAKSILAIAAYTVALPVGVFLGHHRFMLFLIKLCDHLGKLLAFAGINPTQQQYITD